MARAADCSVRRRNRAAFQRASSLLVVGLDSGVFGIYDMPGFVNIHTLSISQHAINTVSINDTGEWLAFGSAMKLFCFFSRCSFSFSSLIYCLYRPAW